MRRFTRYDLQGKQSKRWYGIGNIHAKLKATSESMIGAIVVVLNLIRLVQQHVLIFMEFIIYTLQKYAEKLFLTENGRLTF